MFKWLTLHFLKQKKTPQNYGKAQRFVQWSLNPHPSACTPSPLLARLQVPSIPDTALGSQLSVAKLQTESWIPARLARRP